MGKTTTRSGTSCKSYSRDKGSRWKESVLTGPPSCSKIEKPDGTVADGIDFSAMDQFMASTLSVLRHEGSLIARVFPPEADVLLYFLERIANDVVSDYITSLLAAAQPLQNPLFLLATAATFGQVYRLVDCVLEIEPRNERLTKERAEDVIFKVFEPLMDDYLSEEGEWIRHVLEGICEEWDRKVSSEFIYRPCGPGADGPWLHALIDRP